MTEEKTHKIIIDSNKGMAAYHGSITGICVIAAILYASIGEAMIAALMFGLSLATGAMAFGYFVRKTPYGIEKPLKLWKIKQKS